MNKKENYERPSKTKQKTGGCALLLAVPLALEAVELADKHLWDQIREKQNNTEDKAFFSFSLLACFLVGFP